jgi:hypothetical protein
MQGVQTHFADDIGIRGLPLVLQLDERFVDCLGSSVPGQGTDQADYSQYGSSSSRLHPVSPTELDGRYHCHGRLWAVRMKPYLHSIVD